MFRLIVGIFLGSGMFISLDAQAVASSAVQETAGSQGISVAFENTPLQEAIWTISKRSGKTIVFAGDLLPAKRVSYKGVGVKPSEALVAILKGTGIRADVAPDGNFTLVKATQGASGKAQGVISGKVTDSKTGKGISGATVSIAAASSGSVTAEDGSYRLANVASGTHAVTVRTVGYAKQSRSVTVGEDAIVTADFRLEPSASVLDQVVVTGTVVATELKAVPNAITIVTAKEIEQRGITRVDQLFRGDIPGLFSLNTGSFGALDEVNMFSRGATKLPSTFNSTGQVASNPIKVYVDGVELSDATYLNQIDPRSIDRIEVIAGPQASTIYGSNAINGVMQIFTKRGSSPRPLIVSSIISGVIQNNFSSGLAPAHAADIQVSGSEGKLSYTVGGSGDYVGPWTPAKTTVRTGGYGSVRYVMDVFTADASGRYGITSNKEGGAASERTTLLYEEGDVLPIAAAGVAAPRKSARQNRTFGTTLTYTPVTGWTHEVAFGTDAAYFEQSTSVPSYIRLGDTTQSVRYIQSGRISRRYTTTLSVPLANSIYLTGSSGVDYWRSRISGGSGSGTTGLTGLLLFPSVSREPSDKNLGAFFQGQLGIADALFMTYGLRAEWNPNYGAEAQPNMAPRTGITYSGDFRGVTAKLRASYGRSTRPPSRGLKDAAYILGPSLTVTEFGQFIGRFANPDLGPEFQQGGEGGLELYLGNRASLSVTRFNQTVDALIASVSGVDSIRSLVPNPSQASSTFRDADMHGYRYQGQNLNVGSLRNQGWELQGSVNTGPFTTRGTYSWTKSRVIGITPRYRSILTGSQYQVGRTFDYLPEHTWSLITAYSNAASQISLHFNGIAQLFREFDDLQYAVGFNTFYRYLNNRARVGVPGGYRSVGPGYVMADLNASRRFTPRIEGVFQVQNLANFYQNDAHAGYAAIGRQTKTGVRIRW